MDVETGSRETPDLPNIFAGGGAAGLVNALSALPIALVGKTTCAYSREAQATLVQAAADVGSAAVVTCYWLDELQQGAAIHHALKKELGQKTVPYIFVNGEFLGGCDDVKKLQVSGGLASKVHAAAMAHSLPTTAVFHAHPDDGKLEAGDSGSVGAAAAPANGAHSHGPPLPDAALQHDVVTRPALADDAPRAYPCMFWFPEVVDSNVVRLTAIQVVVICILGIAFRKHTWAHYMVLGLAIDGLGRVMFGPGPSPLGQVARCAASQLSPTYRPGVPKQFAAACGMFMATVATVLLFTHGYDHQKIIASCFLGVYAFLAFLEASVDFCMGCVMFGWSVSFGLLPKEVYSVGVAAKPEMEYTYEEAVKREALPAPKHVRIGYPGKPPSAVDARYKTKLNDHDRQSFHVIKHVKVMQFSIVLGVCGAAVLWRAAAMPLIGGAAGLDVPPTTADVLTCMAVVVYVVFGLLYAAKAAMYPRKCGKEWMCPLRSNMFVIPPAALVLIAFAAAPAGFDGALTLAKVLFWLGAPATLALALYLAARWVTDPHSPEHLNPAWLLPPTACFVCALVAPFLDPRYSEAAYLWYGTAAVLAVPLYVVTFNRAVLFQEPDDRNRPLKWTWVSCVAVACVTQVVLTAAVAPAPGAPVDLLGLPVLPFTSSSRLLYLAALGLAMVLGLLYLTGHASRLRFDASSWALAFPLEALALATLMYAAAVPGVLTNGMAYAALTVASLAAVVLALHTVQALLMGGVFVTDTKYGPLSQQILTHEAFRAAGRRLRAAAEGLGASKDGGINAPALADFGRQFRRYRLAHAWHAHQEETVIFKEFEVYIPGFCAGQHAEHARDEAAMGRWAALLEAGEAAADQASAKDTGAAEAGAQAVVALRTEIPAFLDSFEAHMRGEEEHMQRGGRKHMNIDLQKQMLRRIWDVTPPEVWAEFFPWVIANLPMHAQRIKFVRCWAVWALPEHAQLIGRYIALGVDAPTWVRLAQAVPEIRPRGAPGWRKYF